MLREIIKSRASSNKQSLGYLSPIEIREYASKVGVHDESLVKLKCDEIYETDFGKVLYPEGDELNTIFAQFKNKRSSAFSEVQDIISGLGLEEYESENSAENQEEEREETADSSGNGDTEAHNRMEKEDTPATSTKGDTPHATNTIPDNTIHTDHARPLINRNSTLKLIHGNSIYISKEPSDIPENTSFGKSSTLRKPASIGTSNINVVTRPTVSKQWKPALKTENVQLKHKILDILRRLKLGFNKAHNEETPKNDLEQLDQRLRNTGLINAQMSNPKHDLPVANKKQREPLNTEKRTRRVSLVGENLPKYIRAQLRNDLHIENNTSTEKAKGNSNKQKTVQRRASRIENVLANSQSLYAMRKPSSFNSSHPEDDRTVSSESVSAGIGEQEEDIESEEYILPNLLTRFFASSTNDDDHDEILKGIDEMTGFMNIGEASYEDLAKDNEETDDYLFKI